MNRNRQAGPKRPPSRWEKERRRRRILEVIIAITIISVLVIVGYGYYHTRVEPWHQSMVRVNDRVFDMNYFVKMLRLYGATGENPTQDIQLAEQLVPAIQNNELIRQAAEEVGIEFSDEAVDEKLQEMLANPDEEKSEEEIQEQYQEILDRLGMSDSDFKEMFILPMLVQPALRDYFADEEYPEDEEYDHVQVQAMLLNTEDEALDVASRWDTEGFEALVNSTSPSRYYPDDDVEWLPRGIESEEFDGFAFDGGSVGALSDPIADDEYYTQGGYWIVHLMEKSGEGEEEEWHIRGILLDSSETADYVRGEISHDPGTFADLAAEYSLHSSTKESGGDMGFLDVDTAKTRFTDAVADLEENDYSDPMYHETVSKKAGYWLIRVLDTESRTLSEDHRTSLVSELYNNWIEEERESEDNLLEDYLDDNKIIWALTHIEP